MKILIVICADIHDKFVDQKHLYSCCKVQSTTTYINTNNYISCFIVICVDMHI